MGSLTALDIIVLLLVGGGALFGVLRGFVCEALSLIAWVLAIMAVKFFHTPVSAMLAGPVGTDAGAAVLAFALLFGVTFLLGKWLARAIGARTRQSVLGPVDRVLGLGFGAVKGLIGATLLFLLVTMVLDTINGGATRRPEWVRDSRTYPLLSASGRALVDYMNERRSGGDAVP
jgi:membrane protein required for colicin V production